VLAAGSLVHFVIALVLLLVIFMALGTPKPSTTVGQVAPCVPTKPTATSCQAADTASPAQQAGVQPGDRAVSFNGTAVTSWDQLSRLIRKAGSGPAQLVVVRDGEQVRLTPDLVTRTRPSLDHPKTDVRVAVLGVSPTTEADRLGPVAAVGRTGSAFGSTVKGTFVALGQIPAAIPDLVRATFGSAERSATGLVGPVGIGRVSGDVAAAQEPWSVKLGTFLAIIAGLNVFVGIFNLLPLLPLDGGHLGVLGYEQARSRIYRLVGRPDPGRVDLTRLLPAAYLFLALLVSLSVLLLAADIVNPVSVPL